MEHIFPNHNITAILSLPGCDEDDVTHGGATGLDYLLPAIRCRHKLTEVIQQREFINLGSTFDI